MQYRFTQTILHSHTNYFTLPLELTTDRKIVIVPSGKEIIQAVYQINRELDKWERGPVFSIQAVRDIVSQHLVDIMGKVNQEKEKR